MTKRYPLRGALGRGDSRDSRDFEGVALGIFETAHGGERGDLLGGDVHHFYFAALSVVREFRHGSSLPQQNGRISTEGTEFAWRVRRRAHTISLRSKMGTVSPTSMRDRPAATTRKQLACASAMMSPEPCQRSALTCGVVPLHSTRAGRKCARPGFSCSASPSRASTSGKSRAGAPLSKSSAGVTNSSNVTIVDTGLPGSPNTSVSPHFPKTAGLPGRMETASK